MKKKNKGFTMVELMIVIVIMAILAGALAPALIRYVRKARRVKDIEYAGNIQEAIERAIIEYDSGTSVSWSKYTGALAWNKDSKLNNPPRNVLDYAFNELGRMPAPNTNRNWFWVVTYDGETGKVEKIELAPTLMSKKRYEVWPDYEDFLEMKN